MTGRYAITLEQIPFRGLGCTSVRVCLTGYVAEEIEIDYDRRDISAIYLFLEGELVGEAYCTELLWPALIEHLGGWGRQGGRPNRSKQKKPKPRSVWRIVSAFSKKPHAGRQVRLLWKQNG